MAKSFELSSKTYKNGRRKFKAILYRLQPSDCVVNEVGTKYNLNGITFLREYCEPQLDSIKDMSVTVSFIDDKRTLISGHGLTDTEDGFPTFDDATTIGHFTRGYIDSFEIDGENVECVCGEGYLDEMRYHAFLKSLEEDLANGMSVEGSIEIYRTEGNEGIVYKYGYKEKGRIPTEFIHSGWTMVLNPSDKTSKLLELNEQERTKKMDEKQMKELADIVSAKIVEINSKNDELSVKIGELNSTIATQEGTIAELNEKVSTAEADKVEAEKKLADKDKEIEALTAELNELKKSKAISEMEKALEKYSDEEKKCAEVEINEYKADPLNKSVDAIVSKICVSIVDTQKKNEEIHASELNSTVDIFGCMDLPSGKKEDNENVSIF